MTTGKCEGCTDAAAPTRTCPLLPDNREQIIDPRTAYQIVSMLEGVVQRGTGPVVSAVGKPLAGKTGTSQRIPDTWFVGFSPDLAAGVFVGFDDDARWADYLKGEQEQGATVAAPIFRDFMADALKDKPPTPFRVAPGIRFVRVDATTGKPAPSGRQERHLRSVQARHRADRR